MCQDYHLYLSVLQILRLFSESAQSIGELKVDLAQAKKLLGAHNKQLHQLWYRSVTLRHIISLLDQIEGIAKVSLFLKQILFHSLFLQCVLCCCGGSTLLVGQKMKHQLVLDFNRYCWSSDTVSSVLLLIHLSVKKIKNKS